MASKKPTRERMRAEEPATTTEEASRVIKLQPGTWYIGAADTSPIPVGLALDTIEEALTGKGFGTVRFYREKSELPQETPPEVRDAPDANVWASGQFVGVAGSTAPVDFVAPPGLLALGELTQAPPKQGPIERVTEQKDAISTPVLVAATLGLLVVGGGALGLAWWLRKKRKKKNGKRKR